MNPIRFLLIEPKQEVANKIIKILQKNFNDLLQITVATSIESAKEYNITLRPKMICSEILYEDGEFIYPLLKKVNPTMKCFIYTDCKDFSVLQKIFHMHLYGYLLKGCEEDELIKMVSSLIQVINNEMNCQQATNALIQYHAKMQPLLEIKCFYAIILRQNDIYIQQCFQHLHLRVKEAYCYCICDVFDIDVSLKQFKNEIYELGYYVIYGKMHKDYILYIFHNKAFQKEDLMVIESCFSQIFGQDISYGIGSLQSKYTNFYQSYLHAKQNIAAHKNLIIKNAEEEAMDFVDEIIDLFQKGEVEVLQARIRVEGLYIATLNFDEIRTHVDEFMKRLKLALSEEMDLNYFTIDIEQIQAPEDLILEFTQKLDALLHYLRCKQQQDSNICVKQAIKFISENYTRLITLQDLANYLHVSPFYISKIIKNYEGKNFTTIVNDYRIEEAKRLLQEGKRMKEIAYMVGFQSQSYFAKIFKKSVGISPTQYQNLYVNI